MKKVLTFFFSLSLLWASSQDPLPGGKIAFQGYDGEKKPVFVINSDGSGLRQVMSDSRDMSSFDISPDGTKLAASIKGDIFIFDIDGGFMKRLTYNRRTYFPKWSPDGKYISFSCIFNAVTDVCVIDTGGMEFRRVTTDHTNANLNTTWLPNSEDIIFQGKGYDFFIVNINQQNDVKHITNTGNDTVHTKYGIKQIQIRKFLSCSPDGKKIAYFGESIQDGVYKTGICVMNADGTNSEMILELGARCSVDWSPDSEYIVCDPFWDGPPQIYIINLRGEVITNLTENVNENNSMPSWSLK